QPVCGSERLARCERQFVEGRGDEAVRNVGEGELLVVVVLGQVDTRDLITTRVGETVILRFGLGEIGRFRPRVVGVELKAAGEAPVELQLQRVITRETDRALEREVCAEQRPWLQRFLQGER